MKTTIPRFAAGIHRLSAFGAFAALALASATTLHAKQTVSTIYVADDRWVGESSSGLGNPLQISNGDQMKETFLQFDVKGLRFTGTGFGSNFPQETYGMVQKAELKINVTSTATPGSIAVYAIDNYDKAGSFTWTGTNGRPLEKGLLPPAQAADTGEMTFDVTDYISGEGRFSFVIKSLGTTGTQTVNIATGGTTTPTRPRLLVTHNDGADDLPAVTREVADDLDALGKLYKARYGNGTENDDDIKERGIINVKHQPYGAVGGNGTVDDTLAIQRAVNEARAARLAIYFPPGTYKITDTIQLGQPHIETVGFIDKGEDPGTDDDERRDERDYSNILIGDQGTRPTIKLVPANAASFSDENNPKPALYFWKHSDVDTDPSPTVITYHAENNKLGSSYNHTLTNIDVDITGGYPGAIGVSMAGAQGTRISDLTIKAAGAYAGLGGIPGPGGSIQSVIVNDGKHAILTLAGSTSLDAYSSLVNYCTFQNQTGAAIVYKGSGSLTLVGSQLLNSKGIELVGASAMSGNLSVVDSHIKLHSSATAAITGNRNVYLSNVYVESIGSSSAAQKIVDCSISGADPHTLNHTKSGSGYRMTQVGDYAGGVTINQSPQTTPVIEATLVPAWINGAPRSVSTWSQFLVDRTPPQTSAPGDEAYTVPSWTFNKHKWAAVPNFLTAYNVMTGGANPHDTLSDRAALQGAIDNHGDNIFLPAGTYYLDAPLKLKPTTKLFGINKNLTLIMPLWHDSDFKAATEVPLIDATFNSITGADDKNAAPMLADLQLRTRCSKAVEMGAYLLHWQAGKGTVRDVMFDRRQVATNQPLPGQGQSHPMVLIDGEGGGDWYNFWIMRDYTALGYRHLAIRDTTNKLSFYMLNVEYAKVHPMVEITDSTKIDIFAFKAEGNYNNFGISGTSHFRIFGLSGNTSPMADNHPDTAQRQYDQSIRLTDCTHFLIANQSFQIRNMVDPDGPGGPQPPAWENDTDSYARWDGAKTDPSHYKRVWEKVGAATPIETPGVEQFVVYRRGNPIP